MVPIILAEEVISHKVLYRWLQSFNLISGGVDCGLNKLQEPVGSTPLHEIIDEYADSNDAFIRDFIPVLEKMLANGYDRYYCNFDIFACLL